MKLGIVIDPAVILETITEIEEEIRNNGICSVKKAMLYHQLGSVHGLMGDKRQQKNAWQKALELDPANEMVRDSLKSLE